MFDGSQQGQVEKNLCMIPLIYNVKAGEAILFIDVYLGSKMYTQVVKMYTLVVKGKAMN